MFKTDLSNSPRLTIFAEIHNKFNYKYSRYVQCADGILSPSAVSVHKIGFHEGAYRFLLVWRSWRAAVQAVRRQELNPDCQSNRLLLPLQAVRPGLHKQRVIGQQLPKQLSRLEFSCIRAAVLQADEGKPVWWVAERLEVAAGAVE